MPRQNALSPWSVPWVQMMARVLVMLTILAVGLGSVAWWARDVAVSTSIIARAAGLGDETMVEWWHIPEGGTARMHIQVLRADFTTTQEYLDEIAALQAAFPPNGSPP